MGVVWFTDTVPSGNTMAFSSTPSSLKTFITNANKTSNDVYRSGGGTNGAGGLYRASLMYGSAPKTFTDAKGKVWTYKRVVLYISDGVSNQFMDTSASNLLGGQSTSGTYTKGSYCNKLVNVTENASCQTTDVGGKYNGWDRPITQMINASSTNLRNSTINASVFVIALSSIPSTGLKDGVASSSSYFFSAESLTTKADGTTNVDGIIDTINSKVELGDCIPGPSGSTASAVQTDQFVNGTGGLTYPTVGKVVIYNSTTTLTAPIIAGKGGALTYYFPSVPQGTYRMEAYIYYHHPLDPPNVMRQYSKIWSAGQAVSDFTVDVLPSTQGTSFSQRIDQPLSLKLNGDVCAP
jgi:hypothetical protein